MASAFPRRPRVTHTPAERADVVIDGSSSTDVLQAASSETAQAVLAALRDDPATASDIADTVDTSIQNVKYHLDRLEAAGLVEPTDTWYSSRGAPMTVYALATRRLVVRFDATAADESDAGTEAET